MRESLESEPLRTLEIESTNTDQLLFKGWTTVLPRNSCRQYLKPKFCLVVRSLNGQHNVIVDVVTSSLPLSSVNYLQLDGVSPRSWKQTFRGMVDLTQLHLCRTAEGLPAALSPNSPKKKKAKKAGRAAANMIETQDELDPHLCLFPRLEYIRLEAVRFYKIYKEPSSKDFMKRFERAMKSKRYKHSKFPHVDIVRVFNFAEEEHTRLKGIVQECTWDGSVKLGSHR
ncbi:hypothetical protein NEOLEDRAFT_505850 [Neolentinus lepideus HHB14362 ss-1]|uniref:Uncharacterized protein n=1 Tax=Neolentinus lepideus HHB14362 ss-1 TaxID=1314782 RepID=A0A165RJI5_9AGAM|nr:hypothetical protein NEOLEDRAFT_505850 [Neolentinus lepideus HHB14362 ss-1]